MYSQLSTQLLQIAYIRLAKAIQFITVYIENSPHATFSPNKRNHYLRPRSGTACYMSRKGIHIGHHQRLGLSPCRSANPTTTANARASHRSLKRTENQFIALYQVKAYPKEAESLFQRCANVSQIGDKVVLTGEQSLNLR